MPYITRLINLVVSRLVVRKKKSKKKIDSEEEKKIDSGQRRKRKIKDKKENRSGNIIRGSK